MGTPARACYGDGPRGQRSESLDDGGGRVESFRREIVRNSRACKGNPTGSANRLREAFPMRRPIKRRRPRSAHPMHTRLFIDSGSSPGPWTPSSRQSSSRARPPLIQMRSRSRGRRLRSSSAAFISCARSRSHVGRSPRTSAVVWWFGAARHRPPHTHPDRPLRPASQSTSGGEGDG